MPWAAIFRLLLAVCFPLGMLSRFWELQLSLGQCERCFASWALPALLQLPGHGPVPRQRSQDVQHG